MNRVFAGTLVASAIALAVGACGDDSSGYGYSSSGGGGGDCSAYSTCGSCTPVPGCGWCFNAQGGTCASSPDQCANASEFTWTWNPSGCPDVDASVNPLDGGAGATGHADATSGPETGSGSGSGGANDSGSGTGNGDASEGGGTPADSGAGG